MKPLPRGGSIPFYPARRHNPREHRVREIVWIEQILKAIQHLHRRLPTHLGCEHTIQNVFGPGCEPGSLRFAIPMPQAMGNDIGPRLHCELLRIGPVRMNEYRQMGRMRGFQLWPVAGGYAAGSYGLASAPGWRRRALWFA